MSVICGVDHSLKSADDGQPDLPSGGQAELPGGSQRDYLVCQRSMVEART
jgi:hypothetical protein